MAIWCIWIGRNKVTFDLNPTTPNNVFVNHLVHQIKARPVETIVSLCKFNSRTRNQQLCKWIKWNSPIDDWYSLNTDSTIMNNLGLARCGGLIRDNTSSWISGFCKDLRNYHSIMVELWGLLEGLKLATSLNISKLIVQMDAAIVVDLIVNNSSDNMLFNPLLFGCSNLLDRIPHNTIVHIFKETNQCADCLAKKGLKAQNPLFTFCSPPTDVYPLLLADISNVFYPHFTSISNFVLDIG